MKKCFKCGAEKELTEFYKHKGMTDGRLGKCKACTKSDVKNNPVNYDLNEKGVIRVIYDSQRQSSQKRGHELPSYTRNELREWLYDNDYKKLYDAWIEGGMKKDDKPSCDRLDDFKPYTLDNLRLVTWKENREKQYLDIKLGRATSGKRCKPVMQFNSDGQYMAEYVSFSSARRAVGYSMEKSLKSGSPDRKNGFYWRYK